MVESVYLEEYEAVLKLMQNILKSNLDIENKMKRKGKAKKDNKEPLAHQLLYGLLNIECIIDVLANQCYHNISTVKKLLNRSSLTYVNGLVGSILLYLGLRV